IPDIAIAPSLKKESNRTLDYTASIADMKRSRCYRTGYESEFRQWLAAPDLPKIQQADNRNAAHDVSQGRRKQPFKVVAEVQMPGHDGGHNFCAAGNAMRKVSRAYDKSKHPRDRDLPNRPMAGADPPCHKSNQPAADNSFGKDEREMSVGGLHAQARQSVRKVRGECSGFHDQPAKEDCASNVGNENSYSWPERIEI